MQTIQYLYSALALASILVVVILLMAGKSAKLKGRNIYLEAECETKKRIITECLKANVEQGDELSKLRIRLNDTTKSYIGQLKEVEESRSNVYEELERLRSSYNTLMTDRNEVVIKKNELLKERDATDSLLRTANAEIARLERDIKALTPIKRGSNQGANGRFVSKEKITT